MLLGIKVLLQEHVPRPPLGGGEGGGLPLPILRLCLGLYSAPRVVRYEYAEALKLYPCRGVVAGESVAPFCARLYLMRAMDRLALAFPTLRIGIHMDDLHLTAEARGEAERRDAADQLGNSCPHQRPD